jgi:hypothetical protein
MIIIMNGLLVLLTLFILGGLYYIYHKIITKRKKEGFSDLSPDTYPNKVLLADVYKVKSNPGYSNESYSTEWEQYPIEPANSIYTTNYKDWSSPENGTTIPADLNNGLYEPLPPLNNNVPPKPLVAPDLNDGRRRVNFYDVV